MTAGVGYYGPELVYTARQFVEAAEAYGNAVDDLLGGVLDDIRDVGWRGFAALQAADDLRMPKIGPGKFIVSTEKATGRRVMPLSGYVQHESGRWLQATLAAANWENDREELGLPEARKQLLRDHADALRRFGQQDALDRLTSFGHLTQIETDALAVYKARCIYG